MSTPALHLAAYGPETLAQWVYTSWLYQGGG
jgi:hypothetical protein